MNTTTTGSGKRLTAVLLVVGFVLAGCGTSTTSGQELSSDQAPTPQPAGASVDAGGGGGTGEATATGSLVSSGILDATWAWVAGNAVGPGIGGITVTSDKGTFGNIEVLSDGSITFSTGDPTISAGAPYKGTGAQVHMKDQLPCGFTLDNDLTGSDGKILHMKGSMDVVGGAFAC
jgi:hypothetical protein